MKDNINEIVLEIEKQKSIIEWANVSIQSCLLSLESSKKLEGFDKDLMVKDLRDNLNKKEQALIKLENLKHDQLRSEMKKLNMKGNPDDFLNTIEDVKKKEGINNLWENEENKKYKEYIKQHPEKTGKMHITENSITFDFGKKNNPK